MEQFLPFLILIIFGIVSAFSKTKDKKHKRPGKETFNKPKSTSYSSEEAEHKPVHQESEADFGDTRDHRGFNRGMERSETKIEMDKRKYESLITSERNVSDKGLSAEQKQFKRRVRGNLNEKGLVNGIVMSEVLGKPRAMKPYKSVISKRRN